MEHNVLGLLLRPRARAGSRPYLWRGQTRPGSWEDLDARPAKSGTRREIVVNPGQPEGAVDERSARGKLAALHRLLGSMDSALVAFSGGADSAFLAFMASQALGSKAVAVTADSASLARSELRDAAAFAAEFGLRHQVVATTELQQEAYVRNSGDRCYFCKNALMQALEAIRAEAGHKAEILVGVNTDDLGDYRPGQQAVRERGGRWPMVEVGLSKAEIRWLSKQLGLPTWDKPAAACLSSRIVYGVPVTPAALLRIEESETALRNLGLAGPGQGPGSGPRPGPDRGRPALLRPGDDPPQGNRRRAQRSGLCFRHARPAGISARQPQPDTSATAVTPAAR